MPAGQGRAAIEKGQGAEDAAHLAERPTHRTW